MLVAVMLAQRGWAVGASPGSARGQSDVPTASMRPRTPVLEIWGAPFIGNRRASVDCARTKAAGLP